MKIEIDINHLITGNLFKKIADIYIDEDKNFVTNEELQSKPKIIFVKTDWLHLFKSKILPKINNPFKLITHNADTASPLPHTDLLNDSRIIKWYGMNCNYIHEKFQPIPIGIANEKWPHGNKQHITNVASAKHAKTKLVYCNFDPNTTSVRYKIIQELQNNKIIDFDFTKRSPEEYWNILSQYRYVISPPGNSIDCHRVWESIYLNTIPIVQQHLCHEHWKDLPILFINSFTDVTEELLHQNYEKIICNDNHKATMEYYINLITKDT